MPDEENQIDETPIPDNETPEEEIPTISIEDSILLSVKKQLGITGEYESFDPEIIISINSVFGILNQMGVGPEEPYFISDKFNKWDEFIQNKIQLNMVKTYVYMKVQMVFDPPSGAANESRKNLIQELEFRLYSLENFKRED